MSKDCNVMVHMCHRISGTELTPAARTSSAGHMEVADVANEANAKTCVFSHISDQMDVLGIPERLLREISGVYKGNSIWARDLMEIEFAAPAPKKLI